MDGWNLSKVNLALKCCENIVRLQYELENCVRGTYTYCNTYEELGNHIAMLGNELKQAGEEIKNELED